MDEVTCDETIPLINLKYLIVTNLFRDSMQRNANPDYVYNKFYDIVACAIDGEPME